MPVIYNKKVEYAYTDPGVKAHTLSWAEYQALSEDDKMNGDLYFIPDKQPEGNPSRIWTKLGTDPLTTQADDVSGAVNELNSSLPFKQEVTFTTSSAGNAGLGIPFEKVISVSIATIGQNWYVLTRKATDGSTACFVFDNTFKAVTNTSVTFSVWRLP